MARGQDGNAAVRLRVRGRSDVQRVMRGITKESRQAHETLRRESAKTRKAERDDARTTARARRRTIQEIVRDVKRAEREKRKEIERTRREHQKSIRSQQKIEQRARRQQARDARGRFMGAGGRRGGAAGGTGRFSGFMPMLGGLGVGAAAIGAVSAVGRRLDERQRAVASASGIRDATSGMIQGAAFNERMIRLVSQAHPDLDAEGRAAKREELTSTINRAAVATGMDQEKLLGVLEVGQARFSNLEFFQENLEALAQSATASGDDVEALAASVGEFQRQMGVTDEQVNSLIGSMYAAAAAGSVEAGDVSSELSTQIGLFRRTQGRGGLEGASVFLSAAEVLGAGGQSAAETATLMQNLLMKLNDPEAMKGLRRAGVDVFDDQGNRKHIADLFAEIAESERLATETSRRQVFGRDQQAANAIGILLDQIHKHERERGVNRLRELADVDPAEGHRILQGSFADLSQLSSFRGRQAAAAAFAHQIDTSEAQMAPSVDEAAIRAQASNVFPHLVEMMEGTPVFGSMMAGIGSKMVAGERQAATEGTGVHRALAHGNQWAIDQIREPLVGALQGIESTLFGSTGSKGGEGGRTPVDAEISDASAERIGRAVARNLPPSQGGGLGSPPTDRSGEGGAAQRP